jgi:uncharacterized protein (TIGR03086 family)
VSTPRGWATPAPGPVKGAELLDRAVGYTRGSLQLAVSADVTSATPCEQWDLLALLRHMNDALAAFTDAAEIGYVDLVPVRGTDPARQLVDRLKGRACALVGAWSAHPGNGAVMVGDRALRSDVLAAAGALEITVHGWDVAQACGVDRPVPAGLALDLLDVVPLLVGDADRPDRFAERVDVPLHSRPSTRLLAAVGRHASR